MKVGFFRKLRRQRVIRLEEDLDFGINKIMRDRWNFLTLIELFQNLDELESLIQKYSIVEEDLKDKFLHDIEKIKKEYPFSRTHAAPHWDFNNFLNDLLWLSGNVKKGMRLPEEEIAGLPSYHPISRALKILDGFFTSAEKRRAKIEEEEKRITTFILIALQKHIRYMELFISLLIIVIGIIIGWLFSR